ncbi:MAG: hypothetical protein NZ903_02565 [Candidatus Micrarchaeota archaeon]|nr:hypothetical protein [Candidatus Micrarchaeota archaeon]
MVKEVLFPKELKPEESVPIVLEGIYGGTVAGLGMMTIGAFFSPEVSVALVSASAIASGFATTIILEKRKNEKMKEKKKK